MCHTQVTELKTVFEGKCQNGAPETIRTSDNRLRRAVLYPAELQAHSAFKRQLY